MHTCRRALSVLIFSAVLTSTPAYASEILFFAEQLPCSGVPLTCFPGGGTGLPIQWRGPLYVPIDLPANAFITEIDLWGDTNGAYPVGIWDSTTLPLPPPIVQIIPHHEVLGFGPGDLRESITLFARDGFNGAPYFEFDYQLQRAFLLPAGRYYVGVNDFAMVGRSDVIYFTNAFTSDVTPTDLRPRLPGVAIRVIGEEVVPEPSTLLLLLPGAAVLWRRPRARSRAR